MYNSDILSPMVCELSLTQENRQSFVVPYLRTLPSITLTSLNSQRDFIGRSPKLRLLSTASLRDDAFV